TAELGAALAESIPAGTTVGLNGPLGAGKTRLVQAIAAGLGVAPGAAVSPTFVLVQEYHGARAIVHIDAYRIHDEDEFLAFGAEEYFNSEALLLIEWSGRVKGCLPADRLQIEIEETGVSSRRFIVSALGPRCERILDGLADRLSDSKKSEGPP
ncbi:MAG TPA: tRNA (adenosine(37)-N6)-threonylcarbamoyltransferase complex ATPase subunit type 1 TsaE, partial [Pirellulales bacterium]